MNRFCLSLTLLPMLFACGHDGGETPSEAQDPSARWQSDYVTANGLRIHYWRTGGPDRPVMILAHGITDYGLNWTSLADRFQADYDIIMYDARGHGLSDKPGGPYDLDTHVQDLIGLVRALQLDRPILMGHSMGGSTVARAAALQSDMFRALILEDPADLMAATSPLTEDVIPDWKEMVATDRERPKEDLMEEARTRRHPGWPDVEYSRWADSKKLVDPNVIDILHGEGFGDAAETYARITIPTLVLRADVDEAARAKDMEIVGLLKHGRLVHVEGAGHLIRLDRPDVTEREMRAFLQSLDGSGEGT